MFRSVAFAVGMCTLLLPLATAAAPLPVPAGVNLHNGYLEVINHVRYLDGFTAAGRVQLNEKSVGVVGTDGTLVVNHCCVLAGSHYTVELDYAASAGSRYPDTIVPRLCSIRGIPFGYAVVEFIGTIRKTREGPASPARFEVLGFRARRVDQECPVER